MPKFNLCIVGGKCLYKVWALGLMDSLRKVPIPVFFFILSVQAAFNGQALIIISKAGGGK